MYTFLLILLIVASILLTIIILVQNPKGGGLNSSFGNIGNQIMGARQSTDFMEKATWYFAIGIIIVVLGTNVFLPDRIPGGEGEGSRVRDRVEDMALPPGAIPPAGTQQQQQQGQPAQQGQGQPQPIQQQEPQPAQ